jgi:ankyrin repeat protein
MLSAVNGHNDTCRCLKELGADVNLQDKDGNTALILAIKYDKKSTANMIIEDGADIEIKNHKNFSALGLTKLKEFSEFHYIIKNEELRSSQKEIKDILFSSSNKDLAKRLKYIHNDIYLNLLQNKNLSSEQIGRLFIEAVRNNSKSLVLKLLQNFTNDISSYDLGMALLVAINNTRKHNISFENAGNYDPHEITDKIIDEAIFRIDPFFMVVAVDRLKKSGLNILHNKIRYNNIAFYNSAINTPLKFFSGDFGDIKKVLLIENKGLAAHTEVVLVGEKRGFHFSYNGTNALRINIISRDLVDKITSPNSYISSPAKDIFQKYYYLWKDYVKIKYRLYDITPKRGKLMLLEAHKLLKDPGPFLPLKNNCILTSEKIIKAGRQADEKYQPKRHHERNDILKNTHNTLKTLNRVFTCFNACISSPYKPDLKKFDREVKKTKIKLASDKAHSIEKELCFKNTVKIDNTNTQMYI